jgi:ABC-type glycerol-3-phosphate transport system substrate-binding protein
MMKQLIEKFNAKHEGKIVAEYIQGSWDDVETYIAAGVSGGGGIADVIEYYIGGALAWYQQGLPHGSESVCDR